MMNNGIMTKDLTKFNDCQDYLEDRIKEITDWGFKFEGVGYVEMVNEEGPTGGCWTFKFELPEDTSKITGKNENQLDPRLVEILTQDDDSQPESNYRLWMGDLWLWAPYYC